MKLICFLLVLLPFSAIAQDRGATLADVKKAIDETLASKWYERIQIRGYAQLRYNRILETNDQYNCSVCDKSIGKNQGLFLRRARIILFGDVSDRVFIYIQPDYASEATSGTSPQQNYFNIRDAYFDYALESSKEFRLRFGLSKIPFGFENLQSSSNRAPLDRADGLNSAVPNERDIGVFFMYAPSEIRKIFRDLTSNNLKGSGDYGMFAIGFFNGQTLNKSEQNEDLHRVIRLTYPWKTAGGQFFEASIQAYEGQYDTNPAAATDNFYDQRSALSFVMYPQPFGFSAEWNIGQGPEYDAKKGRTDEQELSGGYAQVNYQFEHEDHRFFPFARFQTYDGGRKADSAASVRTEELEVGTEWQPNRAVEFTASWAKGNRFRQTSSGKSREDGSFVRLQAQFNY